MISYEASLQLVLRLPFDHQLEEYICDSRLITQRATRPLATVGVLRSFAVKKKVAKSFKTSTAQPPLSQGIYGGSCVGSLEMDKMAST